MHPLKQWLRSRGFWMVRTQNNMSFFDGGVASVPDELIDEFLCEYARICTVCPCYLIEKPNKAIASRSGVGFRYVMDIDFTVDVGMPLPTSQSLIDYVVPKIQQCIKCVFTECADFTMFVCTCDDKHDSVYSKTGLHLVWKSIYVCDQVALMCRQYIVKQLDLPMDKGGCQLRKNFDIEDDGDDYQSWDSVIDAKIYDGSGMRSLHAHKAHPCKMSKRGHHSTCAGCDGYGHVLEGRPYTIACVLDGEMPSSTHDAILSSTILKPKHHTSFQRSVLAMYELPITTVKRKMPISCSAVTREPQKTLQDTSTGALIRKFLQSLDLYKGCLDIQQIRRSMNGTYQVQTYTKKCLLQKGVAHASNHIFFVVSSSGCSQRCYSEKCRHKEFPLPMPETLSNILMIETQSLQMESIPGV